MRQMEQFGCVWLVTRISHRGIEYRPQMYRGAQTAGVFLSLHCTYVSLSLSPPLSLTLQGLPFIHIKTYVFLYVCIEGMYVFMYVCMYIRMLQIINILCHCHSII